MSLYEIMVTQGTTNGKVEERSTDFFLGVVLSRKDENMITHNY